jgi:acetate kinase
MKILVLNCGSSSVKYQMIDPESKTALAKGTVDRIGMSEAVLTHKPFDREEVKLSGEILDHTMAIEYVLSILLSPRHGVIKNKSEITAVGHRVVHGGELFSESVLITPEVIKQIRKCIDYAPLHNPHNLKGINAILELLSNVPQVAVFDTAFHQKMPNYAYIYGIPYVLYKRYGIRRYGFHGTSHLYISDRVADLMKISKIQLKIITCHLGNGCSISAIKNGISVDTTMGFTPLEGLLMGTRSGDLDPSVILHIMAREELTLSEATTLLNKHSGLQGISGVSSDMREILKEIEKGNEQAKTAFEIFCYRIKKYIGAYTSIMNGVDAIAFTGGIGENAPSVRKLSLSNLQYLGISIDEVLNNSVKNGEEKFINDETSKVKVFVIPTNEELVIALDTMRIVKNLQGSKNLEGSNKM